MMGSLAISTLAQRLRYSNGIAAKSDIASVARSLGCRAPASFRSVTIAPRFPTATAICCSPSKAS